MRLRSNECKPDSILTLTVVSAEAFERAHGFRLMVHLAWIILDLKFVVPINIERSRVEAGLRVCMPQLYPKVRVLNALGACQIHELEPRSANDLCGLSRYNWSQRLPGSVVGDSP